MSKRRDMDNKMSRATDDELMTERLFRGELAPEDVPSDLHGVAALLRAAAGPAVESELASEARVLAATAQVRADLGHPLVAVTPSRRRRLGSARLTAAAMAGAVILGGTAAAAATDNLPDPAQAAVSDALSQVGISVPNPHANKHAFSNPGHAGTAPGHSGTAPGHSSGRGHDGSTALPGNSVFGLCTAFLAGPQDGSAGNRNSSTAFARLIASVPGGTPAATRGYCEGIVASHAAAHPAGTSDDQGETGKPDGAGKPSSDNNPSAGNQSSGSGKPANPGPPATVGGAQNSSSGTGGPGSAGTNPGASKAQEGSGGDSPLNGASPSATTTSTAPTTTTSTPTTTSTTTG